MASVFKRASDKARGKLGKWTLSYLDEHGRRRFKAGFADKARTLELALFLEAEARKVREGLAEPGERARRDAAARPLAAHVEDFRLGLIANGNGPKYALEAANRLTRILADASVDSVADLSPERISAALARLRAKRSACTTNQYLVSVRQFARWLAENERIKEVPKGLARLRRWSTAEKQRPRRALTPPEVARFLAATEASGPFARGAFNNGGPDQVPPGPERAALYRLALGTGFRANELRSLARESFQLDGDRPTVTLKSRDEKNRKGTVQPISRETADAVRPFVEAAPPGAPVFRVPPFTAELVKADLEAADIPYVDAKGRTCDFHALRVTYITTLVLAGVNPKVVQRLARHSTIQLTMDVYTTVEDDDLRAAVEGKGN